MKLWNAIENFKLCCLLQEAKGLADNPGKFIEGKPKEFCEDAVPRVWGLGLKVYYGSYPHKTTIIPL